MRILVSAPHGSIVGGVEAYLDAVLPALAARGHQLHLWVETEGTGRPIAPEIPRIESPVASDVVFHHGARSAEFEEAVLAAGPAVAFAHDYQGLCISGTRRWSRPLRICERPLGPGCLAHYAANGCGGRSPITALRLYREQLAKRERLGRFRKVLAASRHVASALERNGIPSAKVALAPLFVEPVEPLPRPRPRHHRILFLGRFNAVKGGVQLVEAASRAQGQLGPLELVFAGEGPERSRIEQAAARLGIAARFPGWLDPEGKRSWLARSDLLALPSVWPEPFGLSGLEAAAYGVPAVAFAVGGIPEWLVPGETGELAPGDPPTVEGLAAALVRALGDPDHLERLGAAAQRHALRFDRNAHLDRLEALFSELAGG